LSVFNRGIAKNFREYHLIATIFWIIMVPISVVTGLWHSISFVTLISLWALVSTEWGAWQGSRAEVAVGVDQNATE